MPWAAGRVWEHLVARFRVNDRRRNILEAPFANIGDCCCTRNNSGVDTPTCASVGESRTIQAFAIEDSPGPRPKERQCRP